jgi:hypothetical protein
MTTQLVASMLLLLFALMVGLVYLNWRIVDLQRQVNVRVEMSKSDVAFIITLLVLLGACAATILMSWSP